MFRKSHSWLWIFVVFAAALIFPASTHAQATNLASFAQQMRWLHDNAEAVLFFDVFGNNPDFVKHRLSKLQLQSICGGLDACDRYGANFATPFANGVADDDPNADWETAGEVGMDWGLQIANQGDPAAVTYTVNERSAAGFHVIVRFGTAAGGGGFSTPDTIIDFLHQVATSTSADFYAIGGPNEPDIEYWAAQSLGATKPPINADSSEQAKQDWYTENGAKLAQYMKTLCAAKASGQIPANVHLLTPAFNATSFTFVPLTTEIRKNGGFVPGCFDGMAINLYPAGNDVQTYWEADGLDDIATELPIYVTETGPYGTVLYDKAGDDVKGGGFKDIPTAGLPENKKDPDNYHYISPILGLYPPAARSVDVIRDSLANQGYQAYCATPTYTVDPKFDGDIEQFIANVAAGKLAPRDVDVDSSEVIDYSNAKTPILRDTERKAYLKSDMEEFFGYKELNQNTYAQTEIQSAPVTSLLTEEQKCMKTADNLLAIQTMCNKLAVAPDLNCALYYPDVPGTKLTVLKLRDQYNSFKGNKTDQQACQDIVAKRSGVGPEFRSAMINFSNNMEEAYRIAFLVGVVRQKPKEDMGKIFNFFSKSSTVPPSDEVVVISFRIPDIGTNKGSTWQSEPVLDSKGNKMYDQVLRDDNGTKQEKVESGHTFWDDAMTLTRNVLIPRRIAEKFDLDGSTEREKLRSAAAAATGQSASSLIYCLNGQAPYGSGSATCNDESVKAVTDIINGTWVYDKKRVSCDAANLTSEPVNEIGDHANLLNGDNYKFQFKYGEYIVSNVWSANKTKQDFGTVFHVSPGNYPPEPCVVLDQGKGAQGDCTTVNFYLVYPVGYDMETLEKVMAQTFLTEDQYKKASQDPAIKNRFNVFGDKTDLDADKNEEEFTDYLSCGIEDGKYVCPTKEFSATVTSSQGPALFLGARLGYWMHEIQKSFNRVNSLAYKYLKTCRNTEEFLLDQCGGAPKDAKFNDQSYCQNRPDKSRIVRGVDNTDLDRFKFGKLTGQVVENRKIQTVIDDADNKFFPKPGENGCSMKFSVRAVDGLTLILSGGKDIVPNNPGNILGCTGTVSASRKFQIIRLPPDYHSETTPDAAAKKAADPNWKPPGNDDAWKTAEVLTTSGNSASEINYDIHLTPGYYKIKFANLHPICNSNKTYIAYHGDDIGEEEYIYDFVNTEKCQAGACFDANMQSNMEGGGPVYGRKDGEDVILYTIDKANGYFKDQFGCSLSFDYSTLKWNNTCGGGRGGDCNIPGGNCAFWDDMVEKIQHGESPGGQAGSDAYKSVFGRFPNAHGKIRCTNDNFGGSPVFTNSIALRDCDTYTNTLDSLRVFGKIVGFSIEWFLTKQQVAFEIPSREVWDAIQKASAKHGCDPWLVLALASSEGEEPGYFNDTRPNQAQTLGMFEFSPQLWADWTANNNPKDASCTWRQPSTFTAENESGLDFSDRANIPAAVDTACRIILYTGMQKYPTDREAFRNAFTTQKVKQENNYHLGWNNNPLQADYVFDFWQKALKAAEEKPKPQPAGYPYNLCQNGEQPSAPPPTPPTGVPGAPTTNTGTPPTDSEISTWTDDQWKAFWHYDQRSVLPVVGRVTYQDQGAVDGTLSNRQNLFKELGRNVINTCTLDYTPGVDPAATLKHLQDQAVNNGSSQAIGCAASVRLGDMSFRPTGDPDEFRTVWVKPKFGYFAEHNISIGPILIMDVAAVGDLDLIYKQQGASYLLDIGQPLFKFMQSGYGAWAAPQDMLVCDTKEQCDNTHFGSEN